MGEPSRTTTKVAMECASKEASRAAGWLTVFLPFAFLAWHGIVSTTGVVKIALIALFLVCIGASALFVAILVQEVLSFLKALVDRLIEAMYGRASRNVVAEGRDEAEGKEKEV